ncbi:uncharacterized protein LOC131216713 [Anopheles bellator]|uniref:uncharacterized protein LOC131216713 n=1 Tax=Anopheles bellator TaxID=139047 RepID=UPI0026495930|nr:uncharacterized protein LOC131216713 [Anopheles bellator]XP_058067253.1 uncharacterized protein LOC131216713 [Anopheles bellator]
MTERVIITQFERDLVEEAANYECVIGAGSKHNENMRNAAWEEIGKSLKVDARSCETRYETLKSIASRMNMDVAAFLKACNRCSNNFNDLKLAPRATVHRESELDSSTSVYNTTTSVPMVIIPSSSSISHPDTKIPHRTSSGNERLSDDPRLKRSEYIMTLKTESIPEQEQTSHRLDRMEQMLQQMQSSIVELAANVQYLQSALQPSTAQPSAQPSAAQPSALQPSDTPRIPQSSSSRLLRPSQKAKSSPPLSPVRAPSAQSCDADIAIQVLPVSSLEQLKQLEELAAREGFAARLGLYLFKHVRVCCTSNHQYTYVLSRLMDWYTQREFLNTCAWKWSRDKSSTILNKFTKTWQALFEVMQRRYKYQGTKKELDKQIGLYVKNSYQRLKLKPKRLRIDHKSFTPSSTNRPSTANRPPCEMWIVPSTNRWHCLCKASGK